MSFRFPMIPSSPCSRTADSRSCPGSWLLSKAQNCPCNFRAGVDFGECRFDCALSSEPLGICAYALTVGSAAGLYIIIRLSYKRYPYLAYKHMHTVFEGEAAMNIGVQRDSRRASSHCTNVSLEFESTSRA